MARIGKAVREEAIDDLLYAAEACQRIAAMGGVSGIYCDHDEANESPSDVLSSAAWKAIADLNPRRNEFYYQGDEALEAASLLRDGWNPGDPVYLLNEVR